MLPLLSKFKRISNFPLSCSPLKKKKTEENRLSRIRNGLIKYDEVDGTQSVRQKEEDRFLDCKFILMMMMINEQVDTDWRGMYLQRDVSSRARLNQSQEEEEEEEETSRKNETEEE